MNNIEIFKDLMSELGYKEVLPDQNSDENNLIPLSRSNHAKTNSNRPFWNKLFIYSSEIDKWYYEVE